MATRKLNMLSGEDVQVLREVVAQWRAGNLGRPLPQDRPSASRPNIVFGVPDSTITGTTGAATQPASGTVSVYNFTSTGGTSDSGRDVTAYNIRSADATTDNYVVCARDYKSGDWLIVPTLKVTANTSCAECVGSGKNAPSYYTVVVDGIANSTCSDCDDYNGTYIMEHLTDCLWGVDSPEPCGTTGGPNQYFRLRAWFTVTGYRMTCTFAGPACGGGFAIDSPAWATARTTGKNDCLNYSSEVLSYSSSDSLLVCNYCVYSGATVTITANS